MGEENTRRSRGVFTRSPSPSDFLAPFASLQKELAPQGETTSVSSKREIPVNYTVKFQFTGSFKPDIMEGNTSGIPLKIQVFS